MNAPDNRGNLINVVFNGNENKIKLIYNSNVSQIQNGYNNKIYIGGRLLNNNNINHQNSNHQTFNFGNSNFSININGQNGMNIFDTNQLLNIINSSINNLGMNFNFGNYNNNNNQEEVEYNFNNNINVQNLDDYYQEELENELEEEEENDHNNIMKKKSEIILDMDEFQYKHILKYSSRKEDSCAICLQKFKGTDIIKEFYCKHIFHKKCLLKWLQNSNLCPLCKYNLIDEINKNEQKCNK
jgi:hypothetical protein